MSIHKLTAGSGYDYLTRQVAALDATDKGHTGLATYYTEKGETPGVWVGTGMGGIDGLAAGDAVTAEQMKALFGSGHHPLAEARMAAVPDDASDRVFRNAGRLGVPFKVYNPDISPFRIEVAQRINQVNTDAGLPADWPIPKPERARIRTAVAREFYTAEHGQPPANERELAGYVARQTRPRTTAVAGYDLTFSPVKSVSTLWAVADHATAATIERAHQAAVADALAFIETHALYTRTGANGIRQVDVTGMVATAFIHRDSRAGDPDLHTHVAVANKVQTHDGRWLSIDGRVLFKAVVAASETYNTRLEYHLTETLGVRFAARPEPGDYLRGAKREVREIVGVDPRLNTRWSTRRSQVTDRQTTLAAEFRATHGRPPTPVEALHLAQQANLETRQKKHTARTLSDQRQTWWQEAVGVLGHPERVRQMISTALTPTTARARVIDASWVSATAARVVGELEQRRATWQSWHVIAEVQRQLRTADVQGDGVVEAIVGAALGAHSMSLAGPSDEAYGIVEPSSLRRSDGSSVYEVAGATLYSSPRVLAAEQRLLSHAGRTGAPVVPAVHTELAVMEAAANGTPLNPGQVALVEQMATSGRRVQLAIAPAGTGKTTALRALASAWTDAGGNVLALAPSAAAAGALADALAGVRGVHCETLAKLTHTLDSNPPLPPAWVAGIGSSTLVLIDEAGMADTLTLDQTVHHITTLGGTTRLVGDDQQLAAIGAGGVLRDIQNTHGALRLDEVLRFANPVEADATTRLRDGNLEALDFYEANDRVHVGDQLSILDTIHQAWAADREQGLDSLMLAPTRQHVRNLNQRAQTALHTNRGSDGSGPEVALADGLNARVGDLVITRTNNRRLPLSATDWVKNGDRWRITGVGDDGGLDVTHTRSGLSTRLPAGYVAESVELGYASTIHTAQGTTVDTVHGLSTGTETRQDLYTMLTRGRARNHVYVPAEATIGDPHDLITPGAVHPRDALETLENVINRDGAAISATTELTNANDPEHLHQRAVDRYRDALNHACEHVLGPDTIRGIEGHCEQAVPGITEQPAWPTLRRRLIHAAADNHDPITLFDHAASRGDLHDAADAAAVITWRLPVDVTGTDLEVDPRGLPARLADHQTWGPYLQQRAKLATSANSHDTELSIWNSDARPATREPEQRKPQALPWVREARPQGHPR